MDCEINTESKNFVTVVFQSPNCKQLGNPTGPQNVLSMDSIACGGIKPLS